MGGRKMKQENQKGFLEKERFFKGGVKFED